MSNNFHKTRLLKIHGLETLGSMKKILQKITEECSCASGEIELTIVQF